MKPFIRTVLASNSKTILIIVSLEKESYGISIPIQSSWSFEDLEIYCQQARQQLARKIFTTHHIHLENIVLHFSLLFDNSTTLDIMRCKYTKNEIEKLFIDIGCPQYSYLVSPSFYKK